jgi:hypothetical protein
MKKLFSLLIIIVIGIIGCHKDDNNSGTKFSFNSYPLNIGNSWKYHTHLKVDSEGYKYTDIYYDHYWKVISDTMINGISCSKIQQIDSNSNGYYSNGYCYYTNKTDGLYLLAETNGSSRFYLKSNKQSNNFTFNIFHNLSKKISQTDSIYILSNPLYLMKFPSISNDSWISNEYGPNSNFMRKWLADTLITTNAGYFYCKKLQLYKDNDNNGLSEKDDFIVEQYFSVKGLIYAKKKNSLVFPDGARGFLQQYTTLEKVNF